MLLKKSKETHWEFALRLEVYRFTKMSSRNSEALCNEGAAVLTSEAMILREDFEETKRLPCRQLSMCFICKGESFCFIEINSAETQ